MTGGCMELDALRRALLTRHCRPILLAEDGGEPRAGSRLPVPFEVEGRRRRALQRIDAALRRLESGAFGYCQLCGGRIAPGRLDSDPATPVCLDCAGDSGA